MPHGMSVFVNAPSVFRFTASACPERHLEAADLLGVKLAGAGPEDAGEVVAEQIIAMMKATDMPNGLAGVGYESNDVNSLMEGAYPQRRLMDNAPKSIGRQELTTLFENALRYW